MVRVYLPTTGPALAASLADEVALRVGDVGYAATPELLAALAAESGGEPDPDEVGELLLTAAADSSLELLARAAEGTGGLADPTGAVRVVLVCDVPARLLAAAAGHSGTGVVPSDHPAAVAATAPVPWSRAASVMADDAAARRTVTRAVELARSSDDRAGARVLTDDLTLSWFDASEAARLFVR